MIRLFRVFVPVASLALLISEVLLVSAGFVLAAYVSLDADPTNYLIYDGGIQSIVLVLLSILLGLYMNDLYSEIFVHSRVALLQQLCLVFGIAFMAQGSMAYLNHGLRIPVRVMMLGSSLALLSIFAWRVFFNAVAIRVVGRDSLLLVGGSPVLEEIGRYIVDNPERGLLVGGYVDDSHEAGTLLPGGKVLGRMGALRSIVHAVQPGRIVVGMSERRARLPVRELLDLRFAGHIIEEAATAYERVCSRVCLNEIRPSHLIYSGELGPNRQILLFQNLSNFLVAAIGLIVAFPFILATALIVRLSSPGPILYRQTRVGLNGAPFTLYKFRSMRADAEAGTGAVWAAQDDPRVTRAGRILRMIRFDELPQLVNVLKGEMSIVGPRPERPEFVQELSGQIPYYQQRHSVRPGITGWAQINYKYGDTLEDAIAKLEYDLYYIKNMSPGLDAYIIFHTLKAMLLSRGAQ